MTKQTSFTGYYIWNEIQTLNNEIKELDMAMDELDSHSLAHKLLKQEYEKRKQEWDKLQKTKYIVDTVGNLGF